MAFADLKNDFVFRRIFATHPDILRGLLNDLLDRHGKETIVSIEYLPSEQLPLVMGAKLSILDVRCKDQAGTKFVVEMQLIHVPGFINRVVYNACKAYASQLKAAAYWAWLFVHAPELSEVPVDLPAGPYRDALELANQATFSEAELDAYQKVSDEIQQVRELVDAKWAEGEAKGRAEGEAAALLAFLGARGIFVSDKVRAQMEACQDAPTLDHWITRAVTAASAEEVIASTAERT